MTKQELKKLEKIVSMMTDKAIVKNLIVGGYNKDEILTTTGENKEGAFIPASTAIAPVFKAAYQLLKELKK
jgi:hypothetical protein